MAILCVYILDVIPFLSSPIPTLCPCISSREYFVPLGEVLGPVKAPFPSVGECQGVAVGVSGLEGEHLHRSRGVRVWMGELRKGITSKM